LEVRLVVNNEGNITDDTYVEVLPVPVSQSLEGLKTALVLDPPPAGGYYSLTVLNTAESVTPGAVNCRYTAAYSLTVEPLVISLESAAQLTYAASGAVIVGFLSTAWMLVQV
jgi:hypothetical protein